MTTAAALLKEPEGLRYHGGAVLYAFTAYSVGILGLFHGSLHRELTGDDPERVIPLSSQLKLFHRSRVSRVYSSQPPDYPTGSAYLSAARAGAGPIGGNAASFLTSF